MNVLSLFAGIGGFDLGLERTGGFKTVAFCEIDPFCRRVLAKHWPGVPCYDDVRTLTAERLASDGIDVDCIVGGFPCQDISFAGKGAGLGGERSGLWSEYARLIGELRPSIVIVENVSALLVRGLDAVLGTLDAIGYDAEWHCIPAAYVGAPHRRDRIWIVGYPHGQGKPALAFHGEAPRLRSLVADAEVKSEREPTDAPHAVTIGWQTWDELGDRRQPMADSDGTRLAKRILLAGSEGGTGRASERQEPAVGNWWSVEPDVGRVAHGVPARVDRLRSLGNAVVPQIPEMIGRAILSAQAERKAA